MDKILPPSNIQGSHNSIRTSYGSKKFTIVSSTGNQHSRLVPIARFTKPLIIAARPAGSRTGPRRLDEPRVVSPARQEGARNLLRPRRARSPAPRRSWHQRRRSSRGMRSEGRRSADGGGGTGARGG